MKKNCKPILLVLTLTAIILCACQKKVSIETLLSAEPDVREVSLRQFSSWIDREKLNLVAPLIQRLHDNDSLVAQRAVEALKTAGPVAIPQVKSALNDSDPYIRAAATEILASFISKDPSLQPILEKMAKDPHPLVKDEADFALKKLKTS